MFQHDFPSQSKKPSTLCNKGFEPPRPAWDGSRCSTTPKMPETLTRGVFAAHRRIDFRILFIAIITRLDPDCGPSAPLLPMSRMLHQDIISHVSINVHENLSPLCLIRIIVFIVHPQVKRALGHFSQETGMFLISKNESKILVLSGSLFHEKLLTDKG